MQLLCRTAIAIIRRHGFDIVTTLGGDARRQTPVRLSAAVEGERYDEGVVAAFRV